MGSSLYQKYRPKNFDEVVGQELIVKALTNAIKLDRVVHSYIFSGPHGVGKTSIARLFAKAINCLSLNKEGNTKCNNCANCRLFEASVPVDILELDAASNNGVEEIRNLISTASYVPAQLLKKVYILDEAHMLTTSAWTALLKTLEDCPQHCVFILATTEFHKIPLTVLSRCQLYSFQRVSSSQLQQHLKEIANKEGVDISDDARSKIAELSDGSVRDSLTMLEQCLPLALKEMKATKIANPTIELNMVQQVFGLADIKTKLELLKALWENNTQVINLIVDDFDTKGIDAGKLVRDLLNILVDCYIYQQTNSAAHLRYLSEKNLQEIGLSKDEIWTIIDELLTLQKNLKYDPDANFLVKLVLMKIAKRIDNSNLKTSEDQPVLKIKYDQPSQQVSTEKLKNKTEVNPTPTCRVGSKQNDVVSSQESIQTEDGESMVSVKAATAATPSNDPQTVSDEEYTNTFIAIAYENDKELKQTDNEKLKQFKEKNWKEIDPKLRTIHEAEKVVISSKCGIVVSVKNEGDACFLKSCSLDSEFLAAIKDLFGRPLHVVACTSLQLRQLTVRFQSAKKNNIRVCLDPNRIERLSKIAKTNYELIEKHFGKID